MVARYNATGYDPAMTAQHGGAWVRYSDYAELERKLSAALARAEANAGDSVAVLEFARKQPGNENEMPRVISCNWLPDGQYEVYTHPAPQPSGPVEALDEDDYEEIISAAAINMRKATSGIRGQVITVQDSLDWWVMKETERRILSALTAGKPEQVPSGLAEFAKEMCRVGFDGGSMDGCDILDTAVKHGLCRITQYRSDMTGIVNAEYFEEGDAVYVFDGPLLPAAPTAGGGDAE